MAIQRTFSIIKPDATKRNLTGQIAAKFEEAGLRIVASKRIQLTLAQAQQFYGVHSERPFFDELCEFMISEPIVVQVLEGEDAIAKTAKSWAQQTQKMRPKAQSAKSSLCPSAKTPYTAPMRQKPLLKKSHSSSPVWNWLAKPPHFIFERAVCCARAAFLFLGWRRYWFTSQRGAGPDGPLRLSF